jgi:hypothetical protein
MFMIASISPGPTPQAQALEERTIKVTLGVQYGQQVVYPACERAEIFCQMVSQKTLTPRLIQLIKKLGYRVEVIPTEPKEL